MVLTRRIGSSRPSRPTGPMGLTGPSADRTGPSGCNWPDFQWTSHNSQREQWFTIRLIRRGEDMAEDTAGSPPPTGLEPDRALVHAWPPSAHGHWMAVHRCVCVCSTVCVCSSVCRPLCSLFSLEVWKTDGTKQSSSNASHSETAAYFFTFSLFLNKDSGLIPFVTSR